MTEGALVYELEGEPARVVVAGGTFWEPAGDLVHYRAADHPTEGWTRFVAVMSCPPGPPMLTLVDA